MHAASSVTTFSRPQGPLGSNRGRQYLRKHAIQQRLEDGRLDKTAVTAAWDTLTPWADNFQGCLPTDLRAQQRYGQGFLRVTGSQRWKSPRMTRCKRRQSLSNWPCRAAAPRPFAKHVRSFYRLHPASTKFVSQGSECLQPVRFEFARAVQLLNCLGTTIPKPCSSVSGCGPPSGNKSPHSARSSAPCATSFAITLTASALGGPSRGTHAAFMSALLRCITTHEARR